MALLIALLTVRKLEVVRPLSYDKSGLTIVFGETYEDYMRKNGSYTVLTDLGFVKTTYDEVVAYDYEDLTGEYKGVVSTTDLGTMTQKINSAVTLRAKTAGADVGFTLHDKYTFAYVDEQFNLTIGNEIVTKAGTLTDESCLEMGVKKCYADGTLAGYYVYLAVDGEEVVAYLDETANESDFTGSVKIADEYFEAMNGVVELRSVAEYLPHEYDFDKLVVYDLFDLLGVETLQWTGHPVFAQLPVSENVAFRFYVDGNGYHKDGQLLFSLLAFSTSNDGCRKDD